MQHLTCQASSASSVRQKAFGVFRAFLTFCPFRSSLKRHGLKRMLRQSLHHFASFHIRSLVPYFSFTIDWLGSTHSWRSFCRKKQRILPPAGRVQQFLTGIRHDPPYPPNLEALLKVGTIWSLGRCRGPARQSYSEIQNMALVFDRFCIDADSWDLLRSLEALQDKHVGFKWDDPEQPFVAQVSNALISRVGLFAKLFGFRPALFAT